MTSHSAERAISEGATARYNLGLRNAHETAHHRPTA